jgi:hypothetical protein
MTDQQAQSALRELVDKEAIRDLARRYADCVWRRDAAGAVELFTADGVMDTGDRPAIVGRAALLASYESMLSGPDLQPFVHNHVIELRGDAASGRCYLDLRATMEGKSMIGSGHYEDQYVRVGGVWKFRSRKLVMKFFVPIQQGWAT